MITPLAPQFEYALTITLELGKVLWVTPSDTGASRAGVYLTEGTFEGPDIKGIVIPNSGADWPLLRPNGVIDFDARYMLQTDDGAIIYLQNRGFRWGSEAVMEKMRRHEAVDPKDYYFRVSPKFEAPAGRHDWLNRYVFVGVAEKTPNGNAIHYHKVL
ncbi:MAG: DUF3237 domain-containing protein [Phenylobacterium sp.]